MIDRIKFRIKRFSRTQLRKRGYDLTPWDPDALGQNAWRDVSRILSSEEQPILFDVGANLGQTTRHMLHVFPKATVHAFESGPATFEKLQASLAEESRAHLHPHALGATPGTQPFYENTHPDMSSFLKQSTETWGDVESVRDVHIQTLDHVCEEQKIDHIHLLKSDTQGYDLEVLKGATHMLEQGRIELIYLEVFFSELYENVPKLPDIMQFLEGYQMSLIGLYDLHYHRGRLSWADALFAASNDPTT